MDVAVRANRVRTERDVRRMVIVAVLMTLTLAVTGVARAQTPATRTFDIPAQPLATALTTFGQQSGLQVSAPAELLQGRTSTAVKGDLTPTQAVSQLLAGTGLTFRLSGTTVTLEPAPQTPGGAIQLGAVRVAGEGDESGRGDSTATLQADGTTTQGYRSTAVSPVGPWEGRTLLDTPYSVTVIPRDLIENLQATTPDQIYRVTPTVQFTRQQYALDQPQVNLRGFAQVSGAGAYRDGLQTDAVGHAETTEDVERVEVLTGLSGFLYGPANVGGLINYVSKRPTATRMNRLTVGNGGGNNWYAQGDFGGPIDSAGRVGYRVNAVYQDGGTSIDDMAVKKRFISGAFDWHATDRLLWQFDSSYRDYEVTGTQAVWSIGGSRPSADQIDTSVSWGQPWTDASFKTQRYATRLRWEANDAVTLRGGWQFTATPGSAYQVALNIVQPDGTYTQRISDVYAPGDNRTNKDLYRHGGQVYADVRFQTGAVVHKLTAGAQYWDAWPTAYVNQAPRIFYNDLTLDHPTYFDKPVVEPVDRGERFRAGENIDTTVLVGDDITFDEHWSLLAGIAASRIDIRPTPVYDDPGYEKSAATPNLSLIFKPVKAVATYVNYIEALEPGGIAGTDFNGVPVVNAGEVFQPLVSRQVEAGSKVTVGGVLLTAALFQIDKALQYYDTSNIDAVRFVQDGLQVNRGLELTAFGKLTRDLTLTGGLTLLDPRIRKQQEDPTLEGKRPIDVTDAFAKVRVEYRPSFLPRLSVSGGLIYTGDQYGDALNTDRMPAYTLLDIGARYEATIGHQLVTFRLDVDNLTDEHYWSRSDTLGDPRTVLFSMSTSF